MPLASILSTLAQRARAKGSVSSVVLGRHQGSGPQMSIAFRAQSSSRNLDVPIMLHTADMVPALENFSILRGGDNK